MKASAIASLAFVLGELSSVVKRSLIWLYASSVVWGRSTVRTPIGVPKSNDSFTEMPSFHSPGLSQTQSNLHPEHQGCERGSRRKDCARRAQFHRCKSGGLLQALQGFLAKSLAAGEKSGW